MRRTRMNTAPLYLSHFPCVAPLQSKMRNGMEEVVGSNPTRSTKSLQSTRKQGLQVVGADHQCAEHLQVFRIDRALPEYLLHSF